MVDKLCLWSGHVEAWLVDQEAEENHNIMLYPTESNASCNYVATSETFQTVHLHYTVQR
jgi:hypothetical protein